MPRPLVVFVTTVVALADAVNRQDNWPFQAVQPVDLPKPTQPLFEYAARQPAGALTLAMRPVESSAFVGGPFVPLSSFPVSFVSSVPVAGGSSFVASIPVSSFPMPTTSLPGSTLPPFDPTSSLPYDLGWPPGPAEDALKAKLGEGTTAAAAVARPKQPSVSVTTHRHTTSSRSHLMTFTPEGISDENGELNPVNVANRHLLANMSGALIVVSHHKSGTVASQDVIVSKCCPEAQNAMPSAKFYKYFADPAGCAYKACADQNVAYARVGFRSSEPPPADSTTIHFVRDPPSMVVSGYLYHVACNEPSWTDAHFSFDDPPAWMSLRFGSKESFARVLASLGETPSAWDASKATYCSLLRMKSVREGLRAEALRSTLAADGLGMMLVDRRNLREHPGRLLEVCLEDATPGNPAYDTTWEAIGLVAGLKTLLHSPNWYTEHSTAIAGIRGSSRPFMFHYSQELLKEILPAELAAEQPCVVSHQAEHTAAWHAPSRSKKGADSKVGSERRAPRILAAVSSACGLSAEKGRQVVVGLAAECARTPSLSVVLNVFDAPLPQGMEHDYASQARIVSDRSLSELCAVPSATLPSCVVGVTRVRGFKMLFFKHAITAELSAPYDFVWTVDNDLGVNPRWPFDLIAATNSMMASRVAIAQPIVKLESTLLKAASVRSKMRAQRAKAHATSVRTAADSKDPAEARSTGGVLLQSGSSLGNASAEAAREPLPLRVRGAVQLSGGDFQTLSHDLSEQGCAAQTVEWVESQTPIFSREAWRLLHTRVLAQLSEEVYLGTDQGPSSFWCRMMQLELPDRPSCAVLDVPIVDSSFKTIRDIHHISQEHDVIAYMKEHFPQYTDICSRLSKTECLRMLHDAPRGRCLIRKHEVATMLAAS